MGAKVANFAGCWSRTPEAGLRENMTKRNFAEPEKPEPEKIKPEKPDRQADSGCAKSLRIGQ
jgi:hypothetical protein